MDTINDFLAIWDKFNEGAVNVAYAGSEGFGKEPIPMINSEDGKGKKKVMLNNPLSPNSIDSAASPKVTQNWNDGKELNDLHDMRLELDQLEREYLGMFNDSDKRKKIEKELSALKEKIYKTTEKLTPVPTKDLS